MSTNAIEQNPMGYESIGKLLVRFSIPSVVGMFVNAVYNIIDRIFIGNTEAGDLGIAAISICFPVMLIFFAMASLFAMGGSTMFAIRLGQGKPADAGRYLGNTFTLLILSGLVFTLAGVFFLEPILGLLGADAEVLPYGAEFLRIIMFGCVMQNISFGGSNFMRADGSPKLSMISMLLAAVVNIILDYILVWRLHWGMTGAGLATIGGQTLSSIWVLWYFTVSSKSRIKLRLTAMKLRMNAVKNIIPNGVPMFFTQFASAMLFSILNRSLFFYGELDGIGGNIAISGMAVASSLQTMIFMPILGIVQGAAPIVSFNFGARKMDRARKTFLLAAGAATGLALGGYLVILSIPDTLVSFFNDKQELVGFASHAAVIWFMGFPTAGVQTVGANYFQATRQPFLATVLNLSRQCLLLIPLVVILPRFFQLEGILYAAPIADILSVMVTMVFLVRSLRRHAAMQRADEAAPIQPVT